MNGKCQLLAGVAILLCWGAVNVAFGAPTTATVPTTQQATKPININTADAKQLTTIKGIGPSRAAAIIAERGKNGLFKSIQDLTRVRGISEKFVQSIHDKITIN